jgi:hypothetical protein
MMAARIFSVEYQDSSLQGSPWENLLKLLLSHLVHLFTVLGIATSTPSLVQYVR